MRASGRAAASSACSRPNTLSSHHCAASGNESSRSVSPVGAQSTTITSQSPDSWWALSASRLNSSSPPGGTVSSSAAIRSTPRSISTAAEPALHARPVALELVLGLDLLGEQAAADVGRARRRPRVSSDSASECAGSVESTIVRAPAAAQRRAVAVATDVFPTPPLPV